VLKRIQCFYYLAINQSCILYLDNVDDDNLGDDYYIVFYSTFCLFQCPMVLLLKLTVPVVDDEEEDNKGWNRHLQSLQCFTGPVFCIFATNSKKRTITTTKFY
jgi:hypothetical protein